MSHSSLKPGITVVIPSYNRADLLAQTLRSLTNQIQAPAFEVWVVDDGSSDHTQSMLTPFRSLLNLTYVFQADLGFRVAKARNQGLYGGHYQRCLFLDAGVVAPPSLLQAHWQAHQQGQEVIIGLAYGFEEFELKGQEALQALYQQQGLGCFAALAQTPEYADCRYLALKSLEGGLNELAYPFYLFWTCHVSAPTTLLRQVGGFDEAFTSWGGEDFELGLRLHQHGVRFDAMLDPKALHLPHAKAAQAVQQSGQDNMAYIRQKHAHMPAPSLDLTWQQAITIKEADHAALP